MSALAAVRELRASADVTSAYLSRPVDIHKDSVLDSILPRSLVWADAADAGAAAAVCRSWNHSVGKDTLTMI